MSGEAKPEPARSPSSLLLYWQGLVLGTCSVAAAAAPHMGQVSLLGGLSPRVLAEVCLLAGVAAYLVGVVALGVRLHQRAWPCEPAEQGAAGHPSQHALVLLGGALLAGVGTGLMGLLQKFDAAGPIQIATAEPLGLLAAVALARRSWLLSAGMIVLFQGTTCAVLYSALGYARGRPYNNDDVLAVSGGLIAAALLVATVVWVVTEFRADGQRGA